MALCVFGEMLRGKPILQGSSDLDQLDRIFKLCGSPTEYSMPGWSKLPGCEGVRSFKSYPRRVREEFASYGEHAADFLDRLLVLNPNRRLTAAQALDHEFLWSEPYPANPADLPTYESSHEYDRRKRKQAKHHPPGPLGGGPEGGRDAAASHHTAARPHAAPHRPNRPNGYHRQGHHGSGGMRMDAYRGGPTHNSGNYASSGSGAPYGSRPPRGHGPPHNSGYRRY
ncbi:serine/threonine protein kinase, CMGC, CDC2/CDK sub [Dimargaris verticillata]|uniref:Serine/threonine protein kinase, CMGC, CDC2/CDK sub n=1 Tax=Dimargaris verticillata TaxID=2761393 RepID=A0A9W8B4I8_9FUNG|nr:serine/threonine protein kinase, CMGC, CDC2/CDK sub [Dimargaris verticillata]